jgi:hypothetical protein
LFDSGIFGTMVRGDLSSTLAHQEATMTAIKKTVTIQPGGRIEVVSGELPEGRQAEVIILVDEARMRGARKDSIRAGPGVLEDLHAADQSIRQAASVQPEIQPHEYPTAGFIKQTEYTWDEDFFAAEAAVSRYIKESHADH